MDYVTYNATMANLLVMDPADSNFVQILPEVIDYAELRMYRELDLLSTTVRDTAGALTIDSRDFTLPQTAGRFVVVEGINIMPTVSTRVEVVSCDRSFLDYVYPDEAAVGSPSIPQYYAMITDQTLIVGPAPSSAYTVEVVGTIRPAPLSSGNTETFLSLYIPDAFVAASMIFGTGWQRDFGSMADDPARAASWEQQYQAQMKSANVEELRKRYNQSLSSLTSAMPGGFK